MFTNTISESLMESIMSVLTEAEASGQMDEKTENYLHFMVGQSHHDFDNYSLNHAKLELHESYEDLLESEVQETILMEAVHPDDIIAEGKKVFTDEKSPWSRMREGFHAAFPEGESHDERLVKAKAAQHVWHSFAKERGGMSHSFKAPLLGDNGKTRLNAGAGVGVATLGLSLAPHTAAGIPGMNTCPLASRECAENCLGKKAGGNRQYPETALRAKVLRTQFFREHPEHAARLMDHELSIHKLWSKKNGFKAGLRPNTVSDIAWEKMMPKAFFDRHAGTPETLADAHSRTPKDKKQYVTALGKGQRLKAEHLAEADKEPAQIYDYSKVANRFNSKTPLPANYHVTLSSTGTDHEESNDTDVVKHLQRGGVVAMVFPRGKGNTLPTHVMDHQTGQKWRVVNGDDDDATFDRHTAHGIPAGEGVVSGLRLKGVKNEDAGKFVVHPGADGVAVINKNPAKRKIVIGQA